MRAQCQNQVALCPGCTKGVFNTVSYCGILQTAPPPKKNRQYFGNFKYLYSYWVTCGLQWVSICIMLWLNCPSSEQKQQKLKQHQWINLHWCVVNLRSACSSARQLRGTWDSCLDFYRSRLGHKYWHVKRWLLRWIKCRNEITLYTLFWKTPNPLFLTAQTSQKIVAQS